MHESELSMLTEFSSNMEAFENLIRNRVSESFNTSKIAVNLSPLLSTSIFCLQDDTNLSLNSISINQMIKLFVARWHNEILYLNEILHLKDDLIDEYGKFCNKLDNEKLIEFIQNQLPQAVELLFAKTNIERKQLAGEFCKGIMNGFESEMIQKIDRYVTYVLWMPFVITLPSGLIVFVQRTFQDALSKMLTQEYIAEALVKIIKYIKDSLKETIIEIDSKPLGMLEVFKKCAKKRSLSTQINIIRINKLDAVLTRAQIERKGIYLQIEKINQFANIIKNERHKIQSICIKMNAKEFLEVTIPFTYEHLDLKNVELKINFDQFAQIIKKLPKCIKRISLEFDRKASKLLKMNNYTWTNQLLILRSLMPQFISGFTNYRQNELSYNHMLFLAELPNHIEFPFQCIIPKYEPEFKGTSEEIAILSNIFGYLKTINHLSLNYRDASITNDAINKLAKSLDCMILMAHLSLNFAGNYFDNGYNSANDYSIKLFSKSIKNMIHLNYLSLDFRDRNNKITDVGMKSLGKALLCTIKMITLKLNFSWNENCVSSNGMNELSRSISNLINLQCLDLDFGGGKNCINSKGIQQLGKSISNLEYIQSLQLCFNGGSNCVGDKGIKKLSQSIAKQKFLHDLGLWFDSGKNCITDNGIKNMAVALGEATKLVKLILDFRFGSNKISDDGIKFLATALAKQKTPLNFRCGFKGHPNTVTQMETTQSFMENKGSKMLSSN